MLDEIKKETRNTDFNLSEFKLKIDSEISKIRTNDATFINTCKSQNTKIQDVKIKTNEAKLKNIKKLENKIRSLRNTESLTKKMSKNNDCQID